MAEAAVQWRETTVTVDGVELFVRRIGPKDSGALPVVCLHAIAHDSRDFEALAQRIGGRFEIVAVDWPGQGRSGSDHQPPTTLRYGELAIGLIDALGLKTPILIGNSIGGGAAILAAAHYERTGRPLRGLVLCDSAGLAPASPLVARVCRMFERFFAAGERGAAWFGAAYALYYRLLVLPTPVAARRRREIVADGWRMAPILRRAWAFFGTPQADLREMAAALDTPILAAWAADDRVIPLSACLPAIKAMKHATLTRYRAGHAAFLERPDAFAASFVGWSTRLSG